LDYIDAPVKSFDYVGGHADLHVQSSSGRSPFRNWSKLHKFFSTFLAGMDTVHSAKFIHRDIKSANGRISDSGEGMVTDLGLAYDLEKKKAGLKSFGSHSPHQRFGPPEFHVDLDHRTTKPHTYDMWEIGVMLADYFFYPCTMFPNLKKAGDNKQAKLFRKLEMVRRQYRLTGATSVLGRDVRDLFPPEFLKKKELTRDTVVEPIEGTAKDRVCVPTQTRPPNPAH
jgi:serine/threonine protein kinase